MTTTFLLVRHAAHDRVGCFLAGRTGDVPLGIAGREQAQRLAARLAGEGIGSIYASPRKRTQETAAA
ncbi:histidine phosphatase family protein, partial [Sinorhizobium meliloti]|nr:histidine phosphatase family protein [Sinorhizobium meliloti]